MAIERNCYSSYECLVKIKEMTARSILFSQMRRTDEKALSHWGTVRDKGGIRIIVLHDVIRHADIGGVKVARHLGVLKDTGITIFGLLPGDL